MSAFKRRGDRLFLAWVKNMFPFLHLLLDVRLPSGFGGNLIWAGGGHAAKGSHRCARRANELKAPGLQHQERPTGPLVNANRLPHRAGPTTRYTY